MPDEETPGPAERPPTRTVPTGPTVLRQPLPDRARPADAPAPQGPATRFRPIQATLIDPGPAQGTRTRASDGARPRGGTPRVGAPTAITGTERKRIPVSVDDLQTLAPGAHPDVAARALRLVHGYVAEDASDQAAVVWGQSFQRAYADLVSEILGRSQADVLIRVTVYLNRVMEILRSIDLLAVAGSAHDGARLGKILNRLSKRIDTPEELRAASVELDQLVKLMSQAMDVLLALRADIERASHRIDELGDEVEAAALAAQFLSNHLQGANESLSRRFLERSMSLTQTMLQIRGSVSMRESQVEQPLRLIGAIQDVALVMLPAWLGSIASLTVLARRTPTPTEAGEMAFQLRKILEQLQT